MYYKEKVIDGILHCQYSPRGQWHKFTEKQLADRIVRLQTDVKKLTES